MSEVSNLSYARNISSIDSFEALRAWLRDFVRALDTRSVQDAASPGTVKQDPVDPYPVLAAGFQGFSLSLNRSGKDGSLQAFFELDSDTIAQGLLMNEVLQ